MTQQPGEELQSSICPLRPGAPHGDGWKHVGSLHLKLSAKGPES